MLDTPSSEPNWIETTEIEAPAPFNHAGTIALGASLRKYNHGQDFSPRTATDRTENWRMRGVTLVPPFSVAFKCGQEIEVTRFCLSPLEIGGMRRLLEGHHRGLPDGRRYFAALNRCAPNHFHIITQIIPAIAGYANCPGFRDGVLLLGAPVPVLLRGLQLTGIEMPEMMEVYATTPIDVDDLTFSSYLSKAHLLSPFSLSVFDKMAGNAELAVAGAFPTRSIIYICRADSIARPMRNEDALVERLVRDFDVTPVILSSYPLDKQIALFRNARLVIGPHGAGLANVVFCAPGAVLYELLPDHYISSCVNQLAQLRGLHYVCDVHKSEPEPGLWRHSVPWTVDIDAVEDRLTQIIAAHSLS